MRCKIPKLNLDLKGKDKTKADLLFVAIAFVLSSYLNWQFRDIAFFCLAVWVFLNPVPSKDAIKPALFFLIVSPFLLILHRDNYAEDAGILAYYFLIMTACLAIYENRNHEAE